ncbi:MAG: SPOR domain-containing protein [Alphaproteobacteria bacterium]|nr:SPOR domain-containing protein [Alphaproteobacteria bacterium]
MANSSRGTYEPPNDDVHIFDGAEDDDDTEGSRLPLLIVIALFVLAAFGGVVWLAYTQGVARGRSDAPRIIAAEKGPAKVAATEDGQSTPYKSLKIYQQPAPADEEADRTPAPPPSQAPIETQVVPQEEAAAPPAASPKPVAKAPPPEIRTTVTPQAVSPEAAPPPPAAKPVEAAPNPGAVASKPVEAAPKPVEAAPKPAEVAPKPVETAAAPAAAGAYVLQIGAYKSEAEADAAWSTYHGKHAGTLSGYAKSVKQVDLGPKGTWYRLRVGSFASKDAAAALCSKLTAEGGACFPAK